jgi:hypothetical protein
VNGRENSEDFAHFLMLSPVLETKKAKFVLPDKRPLPAAAKCQEAAEPMMDLMTAFQETMFEVLIDERHPGHQPTLDLIRLENRIQTVEGERAREHQFIYQVAHGWWEWAALSNKYVYGDLMRRLYQLKEQNPNEEIYAEFFEVLDDANTSISKLFISRRDELGELIFSSLETQAFDADLAGMMERIYRFVGSNNIYFRESLAKLPVSGLGMKSENYYLRMEGQKLGANAGMLKVDVGINLGILGAQADGDPHLLNFEIEYHDDKADVRIALIDPENVIDEDKQKCLWLVRRVVATGIEYEIVPLEEEMRQKRKERNKRENLSAPTPAKKSGVRPEKETEEEITVMEEQENETVVPSVEDEEVLQERQFPNRLILSQRIERNMIKELSRKKGSDTELYQKLDFVVKNYEEYLRHVESGDYRKLKLIRGPNGEVVWRMKIDNIRTIVVDVGEKNGLVVNVDWRKQVYGHRFVDETRKLVLREVEEWRRKQY